MHPKMNINSMAEPQRNLLRASFIEPIYIHSSILDWVEGFFQLFEHLTYEIDEIFHHNLDGDLFCIRFATNYMPLYLTMPDDIKGLRILTRYKMPWKTKPTYFLSIDSKFNIAKDKIMTRIKQLHLLPLLAKTYELKVNFVFISSIEVYEFSTSNQRKIEQLNKIFKKLSPAKISLYITDELPWHGIYGDFIEMNTLALDIIGEEWIRYDLLNGFQIEDLLSIDLANKDYRHPYCDDYLDRYLTRLITRRIPNFDPNLNNKIEFYFSKSITRTIGYYFIHKYYNRISKIYVHDLITKQEFDYITTICDIPIEIIFILKFNLSGEFPHPDSLFEISPKFNDVNYSISEYKHLNDRVFRQLINFPNRRQTYSFDLEADFYFDVSNLDKISPVDLSDKTTRVINIIVNNCNESNVGKCEMFAKYLIKLFSGFIATSEWLDLKIQFVSCNFLLFDYKVFENISKGFKSITFSRMNFSSVQITELGLVLLNMRELIFKDCCELSDENVARITFLISCDAAPQTVIVEGTNSCTYLVYFMVAQAFIEANGMQSFHGSIMPEINNLAMKEKLSELDFCVEGDAITIRKVESMEIVDFYYYINGIADDEPPPFEYN